MTSNTNFSQKSILRLSNKKPVVIKEKNSNKITFKKDWLENADDSPIWYCNKPLTTDEPKNATLEFNF